MNVTTTYEQNVDESYRGLKAGMRSRRRLWWTCCTVVLICGIGEIAKGRKWTEGARWPVPEHVDFSVPSVP